MVTNDLGIRLRILRRIPIIGFDIGGAIVRIVIESWRYARYI
jgi:hypothetical protein